MAGGSRTLKLSILADVDNLKKNLDSSANEVQTFGDKISNFGKVAGTAFIAAGVAAAAYAGKLAIDGVKAAIEDEAAQAKLATTLKNVTGATDDQIKAVEDQILKTSLLTGKTDDELRPSFDRLLRSTKDVTEAQRLQALALDISAGTGKSLQAVSEALAKAHDGNFTALKKLGGGIDENIIKSKNFDAATQALANTFKDQASIQADTFQGKMGRLKVAFDEAKETVGGYILDAITPLVSKLTDNLFPIFTKVNDYISKNLIPTFKEIWNVVKTLVTPILEGMKDAFDKIKTSLVENQDQLKPFIDFLKALWEFSKTYLVPLLGGALKLAFQVIGDVVAGLVDSFASLVSLITKAYNGFKALVEYVKNNPIVSTISGLFGGGDKGLKASVPFPTTGATNPFQSPMGTGETTGFISPITGVDIGVYSKAMQQAIRDREALKAETERLRLQREANAAGRVNITVNGAIDPSGTARQIVDLLNKEATLSGSFSRVGSSLLVS